MECGKGLVIQKEHSSPVPQHQPQKGHKIMTFRILRQLHFKVPTFVVILL